MLLVTHLFLHPAEGEAWGRPFIRHPRNGFQGLALGQLRAAFSADTALPVRMRVAVSRIAVPKTEVQLSECCCCLQGGVDLAVVLAAVCLPAAPTGRFHSLPLNEIHFISSDLLRPGRPR